jgi:dTDP-4-dehydrorhamnose 3,5-epimerase
LNLKRQNDMDIASLDIEAVKLIRPKRHADVRGYFVETWNRRRFAEAGVDMDFVQDNSSFSAAAGTVRGLHFQKGPEAQAKLVRAARGSLFDVAVDLRRGSPTFGRYVSAVLTAETGEQLFIPVGFAHGFCTLEPDTEVAYKASAFFSPEHDSGIAWDDPGVGISWPLEGREPVLSEKDRALSRLSEIDPPF